MTNGPTCGIVLAGGLSRRMGGGDKALRLLGGKPILAHVIERLEPQCARLVLNANGDPARFAGFGLPVVADNVPGFAGPLAGVLAGLDWLAESAPDIPWAVSVAADTPLLPSDLVARLHCGRLMAEAEVACAASGGRTHPVVALWPVGLRDRLRGYLDGGHRKVGGFLDRCRVAEVEWPAEPFDPFFNVNAPDDLRDAEAVARQADAPAP